MWHCILRHRLLSYANLQSKAFGFAFSPHQGPKSAQKQSRTNLGTVNTAVRMRKSCTLALVGRNSAHTDHNLVESLHLSLRIKAFTIRPMPTTSLPACPSCHIEQLFLLIFRFVLYSYLLCSLGSCSLCSCQYRLGSHH